MPTSWSNKREFCCAAFGRYWHKTDIPRLSAVCPLLGVVSSGRRNTLSQTQETEWMGDGSKICSRFQRGGQRGVVEPLAVLHSQFNRVARQLNERSRETLGFETRAQRDLMLVLHRPIEPTGENGRAWACGFDRIGRG